MNEKNGEMTAKAWNDWENSKIYKNQFLTNIFF